LPQDRLFIESFLQFFLENAQIVGVVLGRMLGCAFNNVSMGQQLPLKECFFDGFVLNEIDVLEEILEVVCSGEAGRHVDSVL
jgi:hypothetical protein